MLHNTIQMYIFTDQPPTMDKASSCKEGKVIYQWLYVHKHNYIKDTVLYQGYLMRRC